MVNHREHDERPEKKYYTELDFQELTKALDLIISSIGVEYFLKQRWFGSKTKLVKEMSIFDCGILSSDNIRIIVLLIISITFQGDSQQLYYLPLVISKKNEAPNSLLIIINPEYQAYAYDGIHTLSYNCQLDKFITTEGVFIMEKGCLEFKRVCQETVTSSQSLTEVSSNNITLVKKERIIKTYRRLLEGINPDIEMGVALQQDTDYCNFPYVYGYILYKTRNQHKYSLAVVEEYIPNKGDLWAYTQKCLQDFCFKIIAFNENASAKPVEGKPEELINMFIDKYIVEIGRSGEAIAELHLALAGVKRTSFIPSLINKEELLEWQQSLIENIGNLFAYLKEREFSFRGQVKELASEIVKKEGEIYSVIKKIVCLDGKMGLKIRVHGDLHLEQILIYRNEYYVIDFEGEPFRDLETRKKKYSPLKDIAGIIRSFAYAGQVALFQYFKNEDNKNGIEDIRRLLKKGIQVWEDVTVNTFLDKYVNKIKVVESTLLPPEDWIKIVLFYYKLDKAIYETLYEANFRPDWLGIPLRGISDCLSSLKKLINYKNITLV